MDPLLTAIIECLFQTDTESSDTVSLLSPKSNISQSKMAATIANNNEASPQNCKSDIGGEFFLYTCMTEFDGNVL